MHRPCILRIHTKSNRPRARIADSSSTNAVSFSSARTMKRFPSSRCASATKIVRPRESSVETQPQLQPALLRLSAIIFQYFVALAPVAASLGLFRGERLVDGFAGKANPLSRDFCNYKTGCLNGLPNMMVGSLFLQSDATSRPLPVEAVVSELVMLGRFASVLRSTGCQLVLSQVVH